MTEHYPKLTESRNISSRRFIALAAAGLIVSGCAKPSVSLDELNTIKPGVIPGPVMAAEQKIGNVILYPDDTDMTFSSTVERVRLKDGTTAIIGAAHGLMGTRSYGDYIADCNQAGATISYRGAQFGVDGAGTKYRPTDDITRGQDIAVLRLEKTTKLQQLPPFDIADEPVPGSLVYSMGYSSHNGKLGLSPDVSPGEYLGKYKGVYMLAQSETNAIQGGNSGGPVVNRNGEILGTVVGVTEKPLDAGDVGLSYGFNVKESPEYSNGHYFVELVAPITEQRIESIAGLETCDF